MPSSETHTQQAAQVDWDKFIDLLKANKGVPSKLDMLVELLQEPLTLVESPHDRAVMVSRAIWAATSYGFKYVILSSEADGHSSPQASTRNAITSTYSIVPS
jgi:hypothetical protein